MTSEQIKNIFTPKVIKHYQNNKDEITEQLLRELRTSKPGKDTARKILELPKNDEGYYLDAFGKEISYQRIPTLKNVNVKLTLHKVHKDEIAKCHDDIFYFMNNYIKIITQEGLDYPDLRPYQVEFIETILPDENESIVGLLPRQSGKSISVGVYLCWLILFEKDINIGIAAQSHSMAKEFLNKVKEMFIELPIWLTPGVKTWNKTSIAFENGVRVLSDTASSNAFRGHTISYSVTDEAAYIIGKDNGTTKFSAYLDSMLPSQSSLAKKKNIFISTANGMNEFYTLYKGAQKDGFSEVTEILDIGTVLYGDFIENHFSSESIKKPKEIINIKKISSDKFEVHYLKRKIGSNNSIAFKTDWERVPRWYPNGKPKPPEVFRDEVIASKGEIFFNQAYGNEFIGSSYTLIQADKLKVLTPSEPIELVDGKLKIYKRFIKGHQYICTVDPAKDGIDGFVVNFTDITSFRLEQVATANLDIDYLLMPEYLNEWCKLYGNPYLIIENNEGAGQSVADQMKITYDYDNLHYDINNNIKNVVKAKKKYPGFRTTKKNRNQMLKTFKTFFDNGNLTIHDKDTINQLFTFILINEKYQADVGCHDDCVMSLALVFSLFINAKNISDMTEVTKQLKQDLEAIDPVNIAEMITVGNFDCEYEEENKVQNEITYEGFDDPFSVSDYDIAEFG